MLSVSRLISDARVASALEQHWHVFLRQTEIRRVDFVFKTRQLSRTVRLEDPPQPRPRSFDYGTGFIYFLV